MTSPAPRWLTWSAALAAPFALYLALVLLLGDWVIDDAGISFAYARNFAEGHGLVSQPGRAPVEGFSNFLYVVLLSPLFLLGLEGPLLVSRVVGAALVLGAFALLQRTLRRESGGEWAGLWVTLGLAAAPPIVIWTASGLENALLLLLAAALYAQLVERPERWPLKAGLLAAALAMTRPDGALYVLAGAVMLGTLRNLAQYGLAFGVSFGAFLAFRLSVFGLPFPHTYYAKRTSAGLWERAVAVLGSPGETAGRVLELGDALAGPLGLALLLGPAVGAAWLLYRRQLGRALVAAVVLQGVALDAYLWLDADWMTELRFATITVAATFVAAGLGLEALRARFPRGALAVRGLGVALVAAVLVAGLPRLVRFAENPPTPLGDVRLRTARLFEDYAAQLGVKHGSILVADVGAPLLESSLKVIDAAGLCEPDVVRTLKAGTPVWRNEHPEFYAYVFETLKPTFISTHNFWTYVTALERDPRFRRDYLAIDAYPDEYVRATWGVLLHSGNFVRRDALGNVADLGRLRAETKVELPATPLATRLRERWRSGTAEERAHQATAAGNPRLAAVLWARALEQRPDELRFAWALGTALDAAGHPVPARAAWARVFALANKGGNEGEALTALRRLGDPRAVAGDQDALDEEMAKAVELLYRRGERAAGVQVLEGMLAANPAHYGATFQLAKALSVEGEWERARPRWRAVALLAELYRDQPTLELARAQLSALPGSAR